MIRKNPEQTTYNGEMTVGLPFLAMAGVMAVSLFFNGYYYSKAKALENGTPVAAAAAPAADNAAAAAPAQPQENLEAVPGVNDKDYVRGDKNAQVVMIEYSDYECPFCQKFHPTAQQVLKEYGNKVAWVYRHLPLDFHPKAQKAAEAAECAGDLAGADGYWKMSDKLMEKLATTEVAQLPELAAEAGLDRAKFQSCLDSGKYKDKVEAQKKEANGAGISGTPGIVLISKNGKREFVPGALPFEEVKPLIDKIL